MTSQIEMSSLFCRNEAGTESCAKCERDLGRSSYTPGAIARFGRTGLKLVCRDCRNDRQRASYVKRPRAWRDHRSVAVAVTAPCKRCLNPCAPFSRDKTRKSGLYPECKDCVNKSARRHYSERSGAEAGFKESKRAAWSKFYVTTGGRVTNLFNSSKSRSKMLGVDFSLTREWIAERLERGHCAVTGLQFVLETGGGKGHRTNSFSPSVDRIKQDGGYTQDNCRLVVWIYNRARGAFPDAHFDRMLDALIERRQLVAGAGFGGSLHSVEVTPCC